MDESIEIPESVLHWTDDGFADIVDYLKDHGHVDDGDIIKELQITVEVDERIVVEQIAVQNTHIP